MKKKVTSKGYTLEVVSWENDGDNYRTKSATYQDEEHAIAVRNMFIELFISENNGGGIGNSQGNVENLIIQYFKANPILCDELDDDSILDMCNDYASELMGYTEWYNYRVCSSATLTYSEKDIYAKVIK